jgi:transcriptional regulator with XRE-family HTH domain
MVALLMIYFSKSQIDLICQSVVYIIYYSKLTLPPQGTENGFRNAVRNALNAYMEKEQCDQQTLAERLKISASAMSTYMKGTRTLGGDVLARACADLGVSIDFHEKRIVAAGTTEAPPTTAATAIQLSFEFDQPLTLAGNNGSLVISVKPVQSEKLEFTVRVLPRAV